MLMWVVIVEKEARGQRYCIFVNSIRADGIGHQLSEGRINNQRW